METIRKRNKRLNDSIEFTEEQELRVVIENPIGRPSTVGKALEVEKKVKKRGRPPKKNLIKK